MTDNLHLRSSRLKNVTATEMSSLLGVNPYKSPAKVLEGKQNPQKIESIHLRRGNLMEPAVLEGLWMDLKWRTKRHEDSTIVNQAARIAATPDAYLEDMSALIECKSIGHKSFEKWYDAVPAYYQIQVAVQMFVTGIHKGYIAALEAGDPYSCEWRLVVWEVIRNERLEQIMIEETKRFWDLEERGKSMRVDSKVKKEVLSLLPTNSKLIHPTIIPQRKEEKDAEEVSRLLSLFK